MVGSHSCFVVRCDEVTLLLGYFSWLYFLQTPAAKRQKVEESSTTVGEINMKVDDSGAQFVEVCAAVVLLSILHITSIFGLDIHQKEDYREYVWRGK